MEGSRGPLSASSRPLYVAGPCSAESEQQVLATARAVAGLGVGIFRAGLWKPRTHPGRFEGVGAKGLPWLRRVKEETGLAVCTEVAGAGHVEACLKAGVDLVWIGARTTANPFLVQEIADALAGTGLPVLVKNPVSPEIGLWAGALERLSRAGVGSMGLVHRGFSTSSPSPWRNAPGWAVAIEMRTRFPQLPFLADPSHMAGDRKYVQEIAQRALDLGFDGLMLECHCCPEKALSDALQQLSPEGLRGLLESLKVRTSHSDDEEFQRGMEAFRARIDEIDGNLLQLLRQRMDVSRSIGLYKKKHNVAIVQAGRWEQLLSGMLEQAAALGLSEQTVRTIMTAIHEESVRVQEPDKLN